MGFRFSLFAIFFIFFFAVSATNDLPHGSESAGGEGFAGWALTARVDEAEQQPRSGAGAIQLLPFVTHMQHFLLIILRHVVLRLTFLVIPFVVCVCVWVRACVCACVCFSFCQDHVIIFSFNAPFRALLAFPLNRWLTCAWTNRCRLHALGLVFLFLYYFWLCHLKKLFWRIVKRKKNMVKIKVSCEHKDEAILIVAVLQG